MTDEKIIEKLVDDQQHGWPLCPRCGGQTDPWGTEPPCQGCVHLRGLRHRRSPPGLERQHQTFARLGAGSRIQWRSSEVIDMEEMLLSLNGPWSNAACIGYCVMAMRNAGLSEKTQRKVLDELTRCFDDVSVEDAAQMKF